MEAKYYRAHNIIQATAKLFKTYVMSPLSQLESESLSVIHCSI